MTVAKLLMFSMLWIFVILISHIYPSDDTLAICLAILCAGAIAKEEK